MQRQIIGQDITSSRTHHILQTSTTLNRRYVRRPATLVRNENSVNINFKNKPTVASQTHFIRPSIANDSASNSTASHSIITPSTLKSSISKPSFSIQISDQADIKGTSTKVSSQNTHNIQARSQQILQSTSSLRGIKNPYTTSAIIRKAAEKIQQNPSSFAPIFDQQSQMEKAFSLVSEQEKQLLENIEKPTAIFTKSKKSSLFPNKKLVSLTQKAQPNLSQNRTKTAQNFSPKTKTVIVKPASKKLTKTTIPATNMTPSLVESTFSKITEEPKAKQVVAATQPKNTKVAKKSIHKKSTRLAFAFFCSAAVVASLFFIAQTNMPDISVRVAAMQTGIQASYPSYIPREYRLSSVYTTQDNSVAMDFIGPNQAKFILSEEKLPWDSNALLNRYVKNKWGENYDSIREQGITIYISGSNAAWVNAGIVYKITNLQGELTKKQIKNIVTSL